jgi:transglutaminase-like putative cysteine protease
MACELGEQKGAEPSMVKRLAAPLVVALLIALAGLSLNRVYNGLLLAELVAGAALGSVLVSSVLRRAPAWLVAPVSVLAMAGYALFAVSTSARAGAVGGELRTLALDAARNAVPRLLTALIPVEPQPDTVLAPVVLAWLAGFAGAELAGRARRPALALLPPTVLYAGALVLVGPNADIVVWQPLAFAALAALGLAAGSAGRARTASSVRPGLGLRLRIAAGLGAGLVAVLAVVGVSAPMVAGTVEGRPIDPRQYVQPPDLDVLDQNPLIRLSGWAANPEQHLFDVTILRAADRAKPTQSASPEPAPSDVVAAPTDAPETPSPEETDVSAAAYDTRLRLAILSDWDGVTWHVDADYRNAGRVLPAMASPPGYVASAAAPPVTVEERITVDELQGRLLPAVSVPHRVEGVRIAYDQVSGTLLNPDRLAPGVQYTVTSVNPSVDVNLLPAADVPSGPPVARYLAVGPAVPPDLSRLAEQVATGESSPYLRALALQSFLADHYRYTTDAPSGHAYPNLRFFLFDDPRAGGQRGTSEQFATAFATLGRLMGLPTRVVVGFRTPSGGGPITGADGLAWPEVLFIGIGWVAFDPLPDPGTPPRPLEDEFLPKPPPPTSPPVSVEPPEPSTFTAPPSSRSAAAIGAPGPGAAVIAGGVGGGLLSVLVLFLLILLLLRMMRRRSWLNRGSPPQRVLGAWQDVLDTLTLAGAPPPVHLAAVEVAQHAATVARGGASHHRTRRPRPAAPDLGELAASVNAVGFGGATSASTDDLAAFGAKAQAVAYARAVRSRRTWWRRLLWRVDPRPLRRR